jgi:hypothetical protein
MRRGVLWVGAVFLGSIGACAVLSHEESMPPLTPERAVGTVFLGLALVLMTLCLAQKGPK